MAGKSEETGAGADWLGPLFARLSARIEEAVKAVCEGEIETAEQAETTARRAGVIARAAKLVDAIRPRVEAESEEDGMGGRNYDPEETERLRRELVVNCDRLDAILEDKRAEAAERKAAKAVVEGEPASAASV